MADLLMYTPRGMHLFTDANGPEPARERMAEVVEQLKGIISIWEEGRYTPDDFVNKLAWCFCQAEQALEATK